MDDILDLNKGVKADEALKVGEKLVIKESEPFLHMVVKKEVNKLEAIDYEKKVKDDASMTKGDTKVEQAGKEGEKSVTYEVTEENGSVESKDVKDEETLKKPVDYIVLKGTKEIPGRGNGNFVWPTNGDTSPPSRVSAGVNSIRESISRVRPIIRSKPWITVLSSRQDGMTAATATRSSLITRMAIRRFTDIWLPSL